jgi:hypothetical protein
MEMAIREMVSKIRRQLDITQRFLIDQNSTDQETSTGQT